MKSSSASTSARIFPPDASGQMPAPARRFRATARPAPIEDLGEELDLTDLLSDAAVKPVEAGRGTRPRTTAAVISTFDLGKP